MNINLPLVLSIFNWRDFLEIMFFYFVIYNICLWLKTDIHKNLLPYFYWFCFCIISAHFLALTTVSNILFIFSPAIILFFMFIHQTTLQRNFIALKNISTPGTHHADWLTVLMRSCLTIMHNNKELLILIEHTDALESFLTADYYINAPLSKDLFDLIIQQQAIQPLEKMVWIHSDDGTIRGINASWKADWYIHAYANKDSWIDGAIAHTSKNDALLLHINPKKQTYTIITSGTLYQELSLEQTNYLLRKKFHHLNPVTKKGYTYDVTIKKNNVAQHIS